MIELYTQPKQDAAKRAPFGQIVLPVLLAGLVLLALVLGEAYSQHGNGDFWSVAVPGALTGVGTLALAAATVWVSLRESKRDDRLRESERRAVEARDTAHTDAEALREAQKVLVNLLPPAAPAGHGAPYTSDVEITNAGTGPIVDLSVTGFKAEKPEVKEPDWGDFSWDFADHAHRYHSHLLSGQSVRIGGHWTVAARPRAGQQAVGTMPMPDNLWKNIHMSITWTDSAGRSWSRTGRELPSRLDPPR